MNQLINQVIDWSEERNIIKGSTAKTQFIKAVSELGEVGDAVLKDDLDGLEDGIGDTLVCLINVCSIAGTDLETCLTRAYESIKDRDGVMYNDVFVKSTDKSYNRILRLLKKEQDVYNTNIQE